MKFQLLLLRGKTEENDDLKENRKNSSIRLLTIFLTSARRFFQYRI